MDAAATPSASAAPPQLASPEPVWRSHRPPFGELAVAILIGLALRAALLWLVPHVPARRKSPDASWIERTLLP